LGCEFRRVAMAKVKEKSVSYKTQQRRKRQGPTSGLRLTATQLRKLPPRERSRVLALQANHAAGMFAAKKDEIIGSSSDVIEY
jgi:hypothetical protein